MFVADGVRGCFARAWSDSLALKRAAVAGLQGSGRRKGPGAVMVVRMALLERFLP